MNRGELVHVLCTLMYLNDDLKDQCTLTTSSRRKLYDSIKYMQKMFDHCAQKAIDDFVTKRRRKNWKM